MNRFDCTVIGDIFFDIPARDFNQQFLAGGTSYCDFSKPIPSGSGNVAAGISALGGKAAFIGKAGTDVFAKLYKQDLKKWGVITKIFLDNSLPTGLIISIIEENQRSFLVSRGANDSLTKNEIMKAEGVTENSEFVYFCGYSLVHDPQKTAILYAIERSKKSGSKIVFDLGAYNIVESERTLFMNLLKQCDVISMNLQEAEALTGETSRENMLNEVGRFVPFVALKCGDEGSAIFAQGRTLKTRGLHVKCIDTTGAGDAFTSAIIYGLTHHLHVEHICELANWFAAQVVRGIGARYFPSQQQICQFKERIGIT